MSINREFKEEIASHRCLTGLRRRDKLYSSRLIMEIIIIITIITITIIIIIITVLMRVKHSVQNELE
jgi:type IV secretory pathway component VirB8